LVQLKSTEIMARSGSISDEVFRQKQREIRRQIKLLKEEERWPKEKSKQADPETRRIKKELKVGLLQSVEPAPGDVPEKPQRLVYIPCQYKSKRKNGERKFCKQKSYDPDWPFCHLHGGNREALKLAKERLDGLTLAAIGKYQQLLVHEEKEPCVLCGQGGYVTPLQLKAAADVLDRVGMNPTLKVELTAKISHDVVISKMTDEEFAIVDDIMRRVMDRVKEEDNTVDAEMLDESSPTPAI
jgi:hypothetical protein